MDRSRIRFVDHRESETLIRDRCVAGLALFEPTRFATLSDVLHSLSLCAFSYLSTANPVLGGWTLDYIPVS